MGTFTYNSCFEFQDNSGTYFLNYLRYLLRYFPPQKPSSESLRFVVVSPPLRKNLTVEEWSCIPYPSVLDQNQPVIGSLIILLSDSCSTNLIEIEINAIFWQGIFLWSTGDLPITERTVVANETNSVGTFLERI